MSITEQFERVLAGVNFQVISLRHQCLSAFAQNIDGRPALLIRIDDEFVREVDDTEGIFVRFDDPGTPNRCLRIESTMRGLTPMFGGIVSALLDAPALSDSHQHPVTALLDHYEELRAMFARRGGRMTESEIRGLFAELSMIVAFRENGLSASQVLNAWQGPYRAAKDFVLSNSRALEVKSIRRLNRNIQIASADQLDPRDEELRLAVVSLDDAPPGEGRSLVNLLAEVESWASTSADARRLFDQAISVLGLDVSDAYYARWHFVVGEWRWYLISRDFPRIEPSSVPAAVSRVRYALDCDQLEQFVSTPYWGDGASDA